MALTIRGLLYRVVDSDGESRPLHCPPTGLKALATSDFALDCDATGVHSRIWTCPAFLASQGDKRFMRRGFVVVAGFYAVCSWSLVAVSRSLDRAAADNTGLIQSFYTGSADTPQVRRHVREIDPLILDQAADAGVRSFRIKWEGVWYFPGDAQLYLDAWADDRVLLRVDGKLVIEHDISREVEPVRRRLALTKGFHDLEVVYEQRDGEYALNIQWAPVGQPFRSITPERLFPTASLEPVQRALAFRRVARAFWAGLPMLLLLAFTVRMAMRAVARALVPSNSTRLETLSPRATVILVSAALAYRPLFATGASTLGYLTPGRGRTKSFLLIVPICSCKAGWNPTSITTRRCTPMC